jgi:16S rRNA (cytosine1402-N4)-methyltransferase
MTTVSYHEPVLVHETVEGLHVNNQARIIDATVGSGGHSLEFLRLGAKLLGIDQDKEMLKLASTRLKDACPAANRKVDCIFKLVQGNFREIDEIAQKEGFSPVNAILFDLGTTSIQLMDSTRGFSFSHPEAPLDVRIDPSLQGLKGSDLLNALREDQLRILFAKVLSFFESKKLAKAIVVYRETTKFETVGDLLKVTVGLRSKPGLNPATLPFLALRVAVNSELENLHEALPKAFGLLTKGGRLGVITFHSGEEKEVVSYFRKLSREGSASLITKSPILPGEAEVGENPRARSAKLYIIEKI